MALQRSALGPILPPITWFVNGFGPPFGRAKKQKKPSIAKTIQISDISTLDAQGLQFFMTCLCDLDFYFRSSFVTIQISWIATSILRKHFRLPFHDSHFGIKNQSTNYGFSHPFLDLILQICILILYKKMVDFGTTSKSSGRHNPPTPAGVRRCQIRECRV